MMEEFGDVTQRTIVKGEYGSKGYGYVRFKNPKSAILASQTKNIEYKGHKIYMNLLQAK